MISFTTYTGSGDVGVFTSTASVACPDLLRYEQIGEADGWRGRDEAGRLRI